MAKPRALLAELEGCFNKAATACERARGYHYDDEQDLDNTDAVGRVGILLAKAQRLYMDLCVIVNEDE